MVEKRDYRASKHVGIPVACLLFNNLENQEKICRSMPSFTTPTNWPTIHSIFKTKTTWSRNFIMVCLSKELYLNAIRTLMQFLFFNVETFRKVSSLTQTWQRVSSYLLLHLFCCVLLESTRRNAIRPKWIDAQTACRRLEKFGPARWTLTFPAFQYTEYR
jgi:hypothetical protein